MSAESGLNGLLLLDKAGLPLPAPGAALPPIAYTPAACPTSHDLVQRVRRLSRQRRIGHTGTLDPMASGLLVLCLGWATRLVEYYQGHDKAYDALVTLGSATDTLDALGQVVAEAPVPALTPAQIEAVLARFVGTIEQTPPVYSALKQGGESLHYKARRGEEVSVAPRTVTFHAITLRAFTPPATLHLHVRCAAGAYIRSLAADIGRALGTVATLGALRRTQAGAFTVAEAHTLETIEHAAAVGALAALLLPPGRGLQIPAATAPPALCTRLGQGQAIPAAALVPLPQHTLTTSMEGSSANMEDRTDAPLIQLVDAQGGLLGILRRVPAAAAAAPSVRAEKWFA